MTATISRSSAILGAARTLGLLATGKLKSTTLGQFQTMSGLELTDQDGVLREDLPPIQRWLNRILAMKIAVQNAIFDEFLTLVETRVSAANPAFLHGHPNLYHFCGQGPQLRPDGREGRGVGRE